ncbi:MAG: hypothetical protein ACRCZF_12695 [Gemmataceae bacterium]
MAIVVKDAELLSEFAKAEVRQIFGPDGVLLGEFIPAGIGRFPPNAKIPFTESEIAEMRQAKTGRPLADILKSLRERE